MAKINVIMGIYNCADTLKESFECLLRQTYNDWLLIMCDDGSTDGTYDLAENLQKEYPNKIILIKNETNRGLNYTLNRCLSIANSEYIARMDGDDLCSPERFEIEVSLLESNKDIAFVSTAIEHFDNSGTWGYVSHPEYPRLKDFVHGTPFCHASCMIRKDAFDAVDGYTEDKKLLRVEDYHLWIKLYKKGYIGHNIDNPLYQMRDDRNAIARRKFKYRINEAYVRTLAVKELKLPFYCYIYSLRPILVGLVPKFIYKLLHKINIKNKK